MPILTLHIWQYYTPWMTKLYAYDPSSVYNRVVSATGTPHLVKK